MQLEALCIQLGITQHIPALSEFRDALLRDTAAALQTLAAEKDAEKASALAALQAETAALKTPPTPADDSITRIDSDIVLQRMTAAERESLFTARRTIWQVDYFLTRAASTGIVSTADPDLPAAKELFAAYGIIAADRWDALLAP